MDQSRQPFFGKNESKHSGAEQPTDDMAGHTFFPFSNLRRNSFGKSRALSACVCRNKVRERERYISVHT